MLSMDLELLRWVGALALQKAILILPLVLLTLAAAHAFEVLVNWWKGVDIVGFVVDSKKGLAFRASKSMDAETILDKDLLVHSEIEGIKEGNDWVRVKRIKQGSDWVKVPRNRFLPIKIDGAQVIRSLEEIEAQKKKLAAERKKLEARLKLMEEDLVSQPLPEEKMKVLYQKVEELRDKRNADTAKQTATEQPQTAPTSSTSSISSFFGQIKKKISNTFERPTAEEAKPSVIEKPTITEEPPTTEKPTTIVTTESTYLVDNTKLQAKDPGVGYRVTKNLNDKREGVLAEWGTLVTGIDDGSNWVFVSENGEPVGFLPKSINGFPVLVSASKEHFAASVVAHVEAEGLEVGQFVSVTSSKDIYERECHACEIHSPESLAEKLGQEGKILTVDLPDGTAKVDNHIGWVPIKCLTRVQMTSDDVMQQADCFLVDNSQLKATSNGLGYRTTKNMADKHPHELAKWNEIVYGTQEDEQWVKVGNRFLPIFSENGAQVLVKCDPDSPHSLAEAEEQYLVDNSELQAETEGLGFRSRKEWTAKVVPEDLVPWGSHVDGIADGDDWIKVPSKNYYLPVFANGIRVLRKEAAAPPKSGFGGSFMSAKPKPAPSAEAQAASSAEKPKPIRLDSKAVVMGSDGSALITPVTPRKPEAAANRPTPAAVPSPVAEEKAADSNSRRGFFGSRSSAKPKPAPAPKDEAPEAAAETQPGELQPDQPPQRAEEDEESSAGDAQAATDAKVAQLEEQCSALEVIVGEQKSKVATLEASKVSAASDIAALEAKLAELQKQADDVKSDLPTEKASEALSELEASEAAKGAAEAELSKLQEEHDHLKQALAEQESQVAKGVAALEAAKSSAASDIAALESKVAELEKQPCDLDAARSALEASEEAKAAVETKLTRVKEENDYLHVHLEEQKRRVVEGDVALEAAERSAALNIADHQARLVELQRQHSDVMSDLSMHQARLQASEAARSATDLQFSELHAQHVTAASALQESEAAQAAAESKLSTLQEQHITAASAFQTAEAAQAAAELRFSSLQEVHMKLQADHALQESRVAEGHAELEAARSSAASDVAAQQAKFKELEKRHSDLQSKMSAQGARSLPDVSTTTSAVEASDAAKAATEAKLVRLEEQHSAALEAAKSSAALDIAVHQVKVRELEKECSDLKVKAHEEASKALSALEASEATKAATEAKVARLQEQHDAELEAATSAAASDIVVHQVEARELTKQHDDLKSELSNHASVLEVSQAAEAASEAKLTTLEQQNAHLETHLAEHRSQVAEGVAALEAAESSAASVHQVKFRELEKQHHDLKSDLSVHQTRAEEDASNAAFALEVSEAAKAATEAKFTRLQEHHVDLQVESALQKSKVCELLAALEDAKTVTASKISALEEKLASTASEAAKANAEEQRAASLELETAKREQEDALQKAAIAEQQRTSIYEDREEILRNLQRERAASKLLEDQCAMQHALREAVQQTAAMQKLPAQPEAQLHEAVRGIPTSSGGSFELERSPTMALSFTPLRIAAAQSTTGDEVKRKELEEVAWRLHRHTSREEPRSVETGSETYQTPQGLSCSNSVASIGFNSPGNMSRQHDSARRQASVPVAEQAPTVVPNDVEILGSQLREPEEPAAARELAKQGSDDLSSAASSINSEGLAYSEDRCICGRRFEVDAQFCRKCGTNRSSALQITQSSPADSNEVCICGNVFKVDAQFCRKCGTGRSYAVRGLHPASSDSNEVCIYDNALPRAEVVQSVVAAANASANDATASQAPQTPTRVNTDINNDLISPELDRGLSRPTSPGTDISDSSEVCPICDSKFKVDSRFCQVCGARWAADSNIAGVEIGQAPAGNTQPPPSMSIPTAGLTQRLISSQGWMTRAQSLFFGGNDDAPASRMRSAVINAQPPAAEDQATRMRSAVLNASPPAAEDQATRMRSAVINASPLADQDTAPPQQQFGGSLASAKPQLPEDGEEAETAPAPREVRYLVDPSQLFPDSEPVAKGLRRRTQKSSDEEYLTKEHVSWGAHVTGVDEGDGWVRVGTDRFLPMQVQGKQVLVEDPLPDETPLARPVPASDPDDAGKKSAAGDDGSHTPRDMTAIEEQDYLGSG